MTHIHNIPTYCMEYGRYGCCVLYCGRDGSTEAKKTKEKEEWGDGWMESQKRLGGPVEEGE